VRRGVPVLVLALAIAVLAPLLGGSSADASSAGDEARFVALLNETRAEAGLPPLEVHTELGDLARGWTEEMRAAGGISHADPISAGLDAPWLKLGENVGTGPSVDAVMDAFIDSPGHYANIVDPAFTHVGVAVVWDGERLYTTHRFMTLQPAQPDTPVAPPGTAPPTVTVTPSADTVAAPPPPTAADPAAEARTRVAAVVAALHALAVPR
jgi:hypothetical protein